VYRFFTVSVLLLCLLPFPGCILKTSPPDLSNCTRIEIQYGPSTLGYFCGDSGLQDVLSTDEKKYMQSLKTFIMTDQKRIKAFAHEISLGNYDDYRPFSKVAYATPVYFDCYCRNKLIISFMVCGETIINKDGRWFKYPFGKPNLEIVEPEEIQPFKLRYNCAGNMQRLHTAGPIDYRDVRSFPEPNKWSDAVLQIWRNDYFVDEKGIKKRSKSEEWISSIFKCPSVQKRVSAEKLHNEPNEQNSIEKAISLFESHYAMNPNCKPDSPADMVLLFETKAGWNQHGGPELFTFDNHNPCGGCVLLNDGTVKFIRTEEELQSLRWK
jgi:hypothetical protein